MKHWERVALTCVLGTGIFFGVGGMAPNSLVTLQPVPVAEAAADTWLASDGSTQYYLKGGTLQYRQPTRDMRLSGAYSFRARIAIVYEDGSAEVHNIRMASKGALGLSIDGGPMELVDSDSVYAEIYHNIVNRYIQ